MDAEPKLALARSIAGEPVGEEVGSCSCLSNLPCTPSLSPGFSSPLGGLVSCLTSLKDSEPTFPMRSNNLGN